MSKMVDIHCHLDLFKGIDKNPLSENNSDIKTVTVTNAPFLFTPNNLLFQDAQNIRVALGFHPELASQYQDQIDLFKDNINKTKYIGEIGLDGSDNFKHTFDIQVKVFEQLLREIKKTNHKVLSVHTRGAVLKSIEVISKYLQFTGHTIIFHWFSGSLQELIIAIEKDFYFSVNHKMVNTKKGNDIIASIPVNRLLTETDAPFTFDKNITNRIKSLEATIRGISNIKDLSFDNAKEMIYQNFIRILNDAE